ncbi:UNVERIFIED_CONTAM: hypothetical protein FKN15_005382 [Acipenser sinensis]
MTRFPAEVAELLMQDSRVCVHFIGTLLAMLHSSEEASVLEEVIQVLVQLLVELKSDQLLHCVLEECEKKLLGPASVRRCLPLFTFLGKLLESVPGSAERLTLEHSFLKQLLGSSEFVSLLMEPPVNEQNSEETEITQGGSLPLILKRVSIESLVRSLREAARLGNPEVQKQGLLLFREVLQRQPEGIKLFSSPASFGEAAETLREGITSSSLEVATEAACAASALLRLAVDCSLHPSLLLNVFTAPHSHSVVDTLESFARFLLSACDTLCIPTITGIVSTGEAQLSHNALLVLKSYLQGRDPSDLSSLELLRPRLLQILQRVGIESEGRAPEDRTPAPEPETDREIPDSFDKTVQDSSQEISPKSPPGKKPAGETGMWNSVRKRKVAALRSWVSVLLRVTQKEGLMFRNAHPSSLVLENRARNRTGLGLGFGATAYLDGGPKVWSRDPRNRPLSEEEQEGESNSALLRVSQSCSLCVCPSFSSLYTHHPLVLRFLFRYPTLTDRFGLPALQRWLGQQNQDQDPSYRAVLAVIQDNPSTILVLLVHRGLSLSLDQILQLLSFRKKTGSLLLASSLRLLQTLLDQDLSSSLLTVSLSERRERPLEAPDSALYPLSSERANWLLTALQSLLIQRQELLLHSAVGCLGALLDFLTRRNQDTALHAVSQPWTRFLVYTLLNSGEESVLHPALLSLITLRPPMDVLPLCALLLSLALTASCERRDSSLEIYKRLFETKRRDQLTALKNLVELNDVNQQYKIIDIMLIVDAVLVSSWLGVCVSLSRSLPDPRCLSDKRLFETKRRDQLTALKNLVELNDVNQQYKIIDIMLKGLFKVLEDSRTVLIAANVQPDDAFPQEENGVSVWMLCWCFSVDAVLVFQCGCSVLEDSRAVLIAANVQPDDAFPQEEKLKEAYSHVVVLCGCVIVFSLSLSPQRTRTSLCCVIVFSLSSAYSHVVVLCGCVIVLHTADEFQKVLREEEKRRRKEERRKEIRKGPRISRSEL